MMWWHVPGMAPWGSAVMTVGMVLFWQLAVFGVIVLIRHVGRLNHCTAERPVPPSRLLTAAPAGSSTDGSADGAWMCSEDANPSSTGSRRGLRLVSSV